MSGSLPAGLNFSNSGSITGTPTGPNGTSMFTVQLTDSGSPPQSVTEQLSIAVNAMPPSIATSSLPGGVVGTQYSATVSAQSGVQPYTFSISSGSLPAGLAISNSGAITGTPTSYGTFTFTVMVQDSSIPPQSAAKALTISIAAPPPVVATSSLPPGLVGTGYSAVLTAQGGIAPYAWAISSGSLPPGLTLNPSSGAITGTPTVAATYTFTATVQDSSTPAQSGTKSLTIVVAAPQPPVISTSALPGGVVGSAYAATLSAQGGTPPYTWSISSGSLPPGLTLNPSNGAITGTPGIQGTYTFTATVQDSSAPAQSGTMSLSIVIAPAPPAALAITTSTLGAGAMGAAYTDALSAQGGTPPYTWTITAGSLPPGLTLNPSTGAITGTPTTVGVFTFTAMLQDSSAPAQTASQAFSITINPVLSISISGTQQPGLQISNGQVQAASPAPADINGNISLTFTPNASDLPAAYTNPGVCFSTTTCGTSPVTSIPFTISAGQTSVIITPPLQTGTVAGDIVLTLTTPGQTVTSRATIPRLPPIIEANSVQILDVTSTGFVVELVANSTPRDVQSVSFTFAAAAGAQLNGTTTFSVNIDSAMSQWFSSSQGQGYGSAFSLQVPFTFSGNSAAIGSVSVTLTNSVGTSTAVTGTQ
jgi:hypothetical protein